MQISRIFFLLLLVVAAAGCAKPNKNYRIKDPDSAKSFAVNGLSFDAKMSQALAGIWQRKCVGNGERYREVTLEFVGGELRKSDRYFSDADCLKLTNERLTVQLVIPAGDAKTEIDDAVKVDFEWLSNEATYYTQDKIDDFNGYAAWGYSDWRKGISKDLGGRRFDKSRAPEAETGEVYYDIMAIKDNFLIFGKASTGDGSSAARRPGEFDYSYPFIKKN